MDNADSYVVFAEVVRAGSFTAAAERLGLSKPTVSKHVAALEDAVGARLLNRTTRRMSLTEAGEVLYRRCRRIADEIEAARVEVSQLRARPAGRLKVSAPMSFGVLHIAPAIPRFAEAFPDVVVDLSLSDAPVDLIEGGFDVGVRIAALADSSLVAKKLAPCRRVIVAAPSYLERHGVPRSPDDLRRHRCLQYAYLSTGDVWQLKGPEGEASIPVPIVFRANTSLALKHAALGGVGLAQFPTFVVGDALKEGSLVRVLDDWALPDIAVYGLMAPGRSGEPKVRAFLDFLARRFGRPPYWDRFEASSSPSR